MPAVRYRGFRSNPLDRNARWGAKLSVVRPIWSVSQCAHELWLCNLSTVSGHYQRNWRVLRQKQSVSASAWAASVEEGANARAVSGHVTAETAVALTKSRRRIATLKNRNYATPPRGLQQQFATDEMGCKRSICAAPILSYSCRFGSKADMAAHPVDVRYSPKSGHWQARMGCPLSVKSRHWNPAPRSGALATKQASVSSIDQGGRKLSYKYCSIGASPTVT
jgi:hypothetical protein